MALPGFAFPRSHRLSHKKEFDDVLQNPQVRARRGGLRAFARVNAFAHARLGIIVGRRQSPLAVQRNRMKRLVRESFRTHLARLGSVDVVVQVLAVAPNGETQADAAALWEQIGTGLSRDDAASR